MKINWFTVIAQVVNFLILVWLLRRFLYKPILEAIDEREKKIADKLADAEAKKAEAKKEQDDFKQKNETFDKEKADLMTKAVDESNTKRDALIEAAKKSAADLQTSLAEEWKKSKENLATEIAQKTEKEVLAMTSKIVSELASISLDEQSAHIFVKRLNALTDDEKNQFTTAFKASSNPVLIRSAFDLSPDIQTDIRNAVSKILATEPAFEFKTAPELISGIELTANGYKLSWSISAYLSSLQNSMKDTKDPALDTN